MAKTIEDRAKYYALHVSVEELNKEGLDTEAYCGIIHGYIKGATEQRKIDIEKMYHALEKVVSKELLEELCKTMEDK